MKEIILSPVTIHDIDFLFNLCAERNSKISIDFTMPALELHTNFVKSNPYSVWNIISSNGIKIGHVYLSKKDEIGIFIKKEFKNNGIGSQALEMFLSQNPREKYIANINPENIPSIDFFTKHGFKPKEIIFQR